MTCIELASAGGSRDPPLTHTSILKLVVVRDTRDKFTVLDPFGDGLGLVDWHIEGSKWGVSIGFKLERLNVFLHGQNIVRF